MKEQETTITIEDCLEIAKRRKWYIIIPFIVILSVTFFVCFHLPKTYKATATILVSPQIISKDYIKSPLSTSPSEYMNVLEESIKSRTALEKVINELGLYQDVLGSIPMEKIIEGMKNNIKLTVNKSSRSSKDSLTSFSICYIGKDPETVMLATNRIVSNFIEENIRTREVQAGKTSAFLSSELEKTQKILETQKRKLTQFSTRNLYNLPIQRDSNLRMLEQFTDQSQKITEKLSEAKNRKILLQQQLVHSEVIPLYTNTRDANSILLSPLQSRLNRLNEKLIDLQNRYTDQHPELIETKKELENLQQSIAEGTSGDKTTPTLSNPLSQQFNQQLIAIDFEIKSLTREDKRIAQQIKEYQKRIEQSPQTEQKLLSLTENYENTRDMYQNLLLKKTEAEQAENLEKKYQEEQFKILDPARVPEVPFKPNKRRIFLTGFILALLSGLGLCLLAEARDQSFYKVKDVESYLELPVLIFMPSLKMTEE